MAGSVGQGRAGATMCREYWVSGPGQVCPRERIISVTTVCSFLGKSQMQRLQAGRLRMEGMAPRFLRSLWSHQHVALASAAAVMSVLGASPTVPFPQGPNGRKGKVRGSLRTVLDPG